MSVCDFSACALEEFSCDGGAKCIPADYECDVFVDCNDATDEHDDCGTSGGESSERNREVDSDREGKILKENSENLNTKHANFSK